MMKAEQLSLSLDLRPPSDDPDERREQLITALRGRAWITARQLHPLMPGWGNRENFQRLTREIAEMSEGRIISGQGGYCLIEEAAPEERVRSATWLMSQGKKMFRRGILTLRRAKFMSEVTR